MSEINVDMFGLGDKKANANSVDIPYYQKGGSHPSLFNSADANRMVAAINALRKMEIRRINATKNTDGTYTAKGKLVLGANNVILELEDIPTNIPGAAATGGGTEQMTVVSWTSTNDYFVATRADGSTSVNVAIPYQLRQGQKPSGALTLTKDYAAGQVVYCSQPTGGTGVTVSSVAVTWQDVNADGRMWGEMEQMTVTSWSSSNDYCACTSAGGTTGVQVALPWGLRLAQKPSTTSFGAADTYQVSRNWTAGDIIYCVRPKGGTGVASTYWQDMNCDARTWQIKLTVKDAFCTAKSRWSTTGATF